jgi:hypothetical protein
MGDVVAALAEGFAAASDCPQGSATEVSWGGGSRAEQGAHVFALLKALTAGSLYPYNRSLPSGLNLSLSVLVQL